MKKEERINSVVIPFLTNFLAVVLGIVITFAVQGHIDRKNEKADILSGLGLVKKELASNINDLRYVESDLKAISRSADYLCSHVGDFSSCPPDSVRHHWGKLQAESYLTLPDDALEMLKSTYLYSPMLDRELSLSIVRAYDICDALQRTVNSLESHRLGEIEKIEDRFMLQPGEDKEVDNIRIWISSPQGKKMLLKTASQNGDWIGAAIKDIEETFTLIDEYVGR